MAAGLALRRSRGVNSDRAAAIASARFSPLLQTVPLGRQRLFLAVPGSKLSQFLGRVAEKILLALGLRNGGAHRLQPLECRPPGAMAQSHLGPHIRIHTIGIEQPHMARRIRQPHLVVLPLHLDEQRPHPFERARPHRMIVHPGPRPPVASHRAAQHQILVARRRQSEFIQQRMHGMGGRRREPGGDIRLLGAGPNKPRVGACPQRQAQAVEQDGFARARLAGQHGEAGAEGQVEAFDENNVANREGGQHGRKNLLF